MNLDNLNFLPEWDEDDYNDEENEGEEWKRSRYSMSVVCSGTIYNGDCSSSFQFGDSEGRKKRKQLSTRRHTQADIPGNSTIWKTYSNDLSSGFSTSNSNIGGTLALTF